MKPLTLGFSPCPNDTFIFHALVHGIVGVPDLAFEPTLADVETLNLAAAAAELDVAKVSYGALPFLLDRYRLLRSGGALGRGCGPLLVALRPTRSDAIGELSIAIPGRLTTANLLLRLFEPRVAETVTMEYDRIMPAVAAGEVDAGLIIHESRFTYPQHGLVKIVDLGQWWEEATGSPIPLGAIVARRSLGERTSDVEGAIRASVERALADPSASAGYVRRHAQEMSDEVTRQHIDLYVNEFSIDVGDAGERSVKELLSRASAAGLVPAASGDPFQFDGST
ncbi:MAG: 1,4-dihydroxy-6-naphthoate synthase [Gemmatimonadota bacterium]